MLNTLTYPNARRSLAATLLTLLFTFISFERASAQQATPTPVKDPATVSGRVTTSEGKPAREVPVVLMPAEWVIQKEPVAKGVTDEEGRYKLTNVPQGRYHLTAVSPGYVFAEAGADEWRQGKIVNVSSGDELKNLDFTLVRGGVVTGRVTDPDGKPVIEEGVVLIPANKGERKQGGGPNASATTDDRGVYRAWGVRPGRYLVYAGRSREDNDQRGGGGGAFYPQTFYPSAADESQAKVVEVAAGGESDDVDITLARLEMTYAARGRVLDEDGRPVQGVSVAVGSMTKGGRSFYGSFSEASKTDERGEFTLRGLTPGDWGVWASEGNLYGGSGSQGTNYSDPAIFEVTDSDVTGLEVKMRRGAEVSGVVTLEGTSDPAVIARFKEVRFGAWINTGDASASVPNYASFQPSADGSFTLKGLRPGRLMFDLGWPRPKGFSLQYIKREGIEQREGLEVRAAERIRNVQVVYAYGTSVIRGEVQFRNGSRPEGVTYVVNVYRAGGTVGDNYVVLDSLGHFQIENLSAGEYELSLSDWSPNATNRSPLAKLPVTVPAEGEVKVTLVYDMTKKEGQ